MASESAWHSRTERASVPYPLPVWMPACLMTCLTICLGACVPVRVIQRHLETGNGERGASMTFVLHARVSAPFGAHSTACPNAWVSDNLPGPLHGRLRACARGKQHRETHLSAPRCPLPRQQQHPQAPSGTLEGTLLSRYRPLSVRQPPNDGSCARGRLCPSPTVALSLALWGGGQTPPVSLQVPQKELLSVSEAATHGACPCVAHGASRASDERRAAQTSTRTAGRSYSHRGPP